MNVWRLVLFVGALLLCGGLAAHGAAWGDIDGDGVLTVLDVRLCTQIWLELIPCPGNCADLDVTGDGTLDDGDCYILAYMLLKSPPAPEIDVQRPAGVSVYDGGTDALGNYVPGTTTIDLRYTIENTSTATPLRVSAVSASGLSNCSGFAVGTPLPLVVPADESAVLDVSFDVVDGPFSLDLEIENSDPNENPYDIHITGKRCGEIVSFADPGLEAAVRDAVGKPTGPLYDCDVDALTSLDASDRGISDLTGIGQLTGLQTLRLQRNNITDIGALPGLANLRTLWLFTNKISDIGALAGMVNLRSLNLGGNEITTIGDLASLSGLTDLSLWWNPIADFGPLANLTNLEHLDLEDTGIADISVLASLSGLRTLYLGYNLISNIDVLAGLSDLEALDLPGNLVADVSALAGLVGLQSLYLDWNGITDIGPLANLVVLRRLDLGHNDVVDIDPLAGLTALERLWLDHNQIVDVGALAGLTSLTWLMLNDNQIVDIDALAGLTALAWLDLGSNQIDTIGALVTNSVAGGLGAGDDVDLRDNPLTAPTACTDVATLRGNGVTVELSPGVCPP